MMAHRRMISRAFTKSKKLNAVARDHRLVYASLLPFLDREGRIVAEPHVLKAVVFRKTDFEPAELGEAIAELARVGLVELYADEDNDAIIEFADFHEHNTPNHKEAKSDLPGPTSPDVESCRDPLVPRVEASGHEQDMSEAMPGQCPGNARAKPGQSRGIAGGEVEVEVEVEGEELLTTGSKENAGARVQKSPEKSTNHHESSELPGLSERTTNRSLLLPHIPKWRLDRLGDEWINDVARQHSSEKIEMLALYAAELPGAEPDLLVKLLDGRVKPATARLATIVREYREERDYAAA